MARRRPFPPKSVYFSILINIQVNHSLVLSHFLFNLEFKQHKKKYYFLFLQVWQKRRTVVLSYRIINIEAN